MPFKNISIIGLPASGKTSYIAALWSLMINSSPYCSLRLESLKEGNQEYLNKISEDWLSFKSVGRTMLAKNIGEVIMNLKDNATGSLSTLRIPDFFGEMFDAHFKDREWTEDYYQQVQSSNGFIVFLDPYHENNIASTIMREREYAELMDDLEPPIIAMKDEKTTTGPRLNVNPKVYRHIDTSNQVKLVEILQYLLFTEHAQKNCKIAFIVSKWDKVQTYFADISPEELVKRNLPLLYQFMQCNTDLFDYKFFGVSAQGVEYEHTKEVDKMAKLLPQERVTVFDGVDISKDIATPITWLTK
jgi:hypothetical protein